MKEIPRACYLVIADPIWCQFATNKLFRLARGCFGGPGKLVLFPQSANQLYDLIMNNPLTIWYHQFPVKLKTSRKPQRVGFPDAWFGSLDRMSSLESGIVFLGIPISRIGPIACKGHAFWRVGGSWEESLVPD